MECSLLNFKRFESGALVGFFDLAVNGLVITGCKAFTKAGDNGRDRVWFGWPSEKSQDKDGNDTWRDIVTASEPVMRHLQALIRPQIQALLSANTSNTGLTAANSAKPQHIADRQKPACGHPPESLNKYLRLPDEGDIPF